MKTMICKSVLLMLATAGFSLSAGAQAYKEDPKYGSNPEEREQTVLNINFFSDAYKSKDYNRAAHFLQEVIKVAPRASQNIYINGINIYRTKVAEATTAQQRQIYLDSLMTLYDLRIENFGDSPTRGTAYLLALKARDYLDLHPDDKPMIEKLFKEAMDAAGDGADPELINIYFNSLVDAYKEDKLATDLLLSEYDRLSKIYESSVAEDKEEQKKLFDQLFVTSGAASCENLEKVFKPAIDDSPDVETLRKVFRLLGANECTTDFQLSVSEKLYAAEPSSAVALLIASAYEAKKDYASARKYLDESIATESDPAEKAKLALRIAAGELDQNRGREAADFARRAIEFDPSNGYAYMILGNAYALGAQNCSGFDRQTAYWLVVDVWAKAKDLLPAEAESLNSKIANVRAGFPSSEEAFFRGLNNGDGYTVNCGWVSGRTTVRLNR